METIVALATPAGNSGVAVIRISGENSKAILQKLIKEELDFEPRKMYLKNVYIKDYLDQCLVVYFRAPFSFTGEDVVEIQSHGGYLLAQNIIEETLTLGKEETKSIDIEYSSEYPYYELEITFNYKNNTNASNTSLFVV